MAKNYFVILLSEVVEINFGESVEEGLWKRFTPTSLAGTLARVLASKHKEVGMTHKLLVKLWNVDSSTVVQDCV